MAKRKYSWTEDKIARYYKDGRGSGELVNYKPWLTTRDVPSLQRLSFLRHLHPFYALKAPLSPA